MVGLLIEAVPGFLLGFAAGYELGSCGPFWDKCTDNSIPLGVGFGLAGALITGGIGAAIGAALGPRNTIVF